MTVALRSRNQIESNERRQLTTKDPKFTKKES